MSVYASTCGAASNARGKSESEHDRCIPIVLREGTPDSVWGAHTLRHERDAVRKSRV